MRCIQLHTQWSQLAPLGRVLRHKQRTPSRPWTLPRAVATMSTAPPPQLLSVAPMMDWTDVHYRQLARLMSRHTWLYTEMVVDSTLIHNPDRDRFLAFPPEQHPIVCQLGGSDPAKLAAAAKIVAEYGYDEINLNCGCPSDRVAGAGCFGAALMLQPQLVADCCKAVAEALASWSSEEGKGMPPITVKCRLGVDDHDSYEELCAFIKVVSEGSPVTHFIIHARKCLLKGLNPHQNRTIPPLRYEWVWALKRDFPHLEFSLNGGVLTLQEATAALQLVNTPAALAAAAEAVPAAEGAPAPAAAGAAAAAHVDTANGSATHESNGAFANGSAANGSSGAGAHAAAVAGLEGGITGVMIGRAAYNMPWDTLGDADRAIFGAETNPAASRREVLEAYAQYADGVLAEYRQRAAEGGWRGPTLRTLVKPLLGMFHNEPRGKKWRAAVDGAFKTATSVSELLAMTLPVLKPETLDAPPKRAGGGGKLAHFAPELPPVYECVSSPQQKRVKVG